jgi:hypothetical protein
LGFCSAQTTQATSALPFNQCAQRFFQEGTAIFHTAEIFRLSQEVIIQIDGCSHKGESLLASCDAILDGCSGYIDLVASGLQNINWVPVRAHGLRRGVPKAPHVRSLMIWDVS